MSISANSKNGLVYSERPSNHLVLDVVVVDVDAVEGSCVLGKISWDFGCRRT